MVYRRVEGVCILQAFSAPSSSVSMSLLQNQREMLHSCCRLIFLGMYPVLVILRKLIVEANVQAYIRLVRVVDLGYWST